jgi:hypothetical protein
LPHLNCKHIQNKPNVNLPTQATKRPSSDTATKSQFTMEAGSMARESPVFEGLMEGALESGKSYL